MHLKSCCTLFLLALVACQAAPSPKIIEEKSISEKDTKLAQELKPEDTGLEKDRTKKSTSFCVEVRSGKEESVPCKEAQQSQPVYFVEDQKPMTFVQSALVAVQYPAPNVFYQPMQQPYPQQVIAVAPQPAPQLQPAPQPQSCEKPSAPQQQLHTYHVLPPTPQVPAAQLPKPHIHPPKPAPQPEPQPAPQPALQPTQSKPKPPKPPKVPHPVKLVPISVPAAAYKTETLYAPVAPLEVVYREEQPQRLVEYVPQEYEYSCPSEQLKNRPSNHQALVHPNGFGRSSMNNLDYNPTIMEEQIPIIAQREMV